MESELSTALAEAVSHATVAIEEMAAAWVSAARAAALTVEAVGKAFSQIVPALAEARQLQAVATPRQWYLMNYGSPRVRKKWRNALRRKARIAGKRCAR